MLQCPHLHPYPLQIFQGFAESDSFRELIIEDLQIFSLGYVVSFDLEGVIDDLRLFSDKHGPQIHDPLLVILYNLLHFGLLLHLHLPPQEPIGAVLMQADVLLSDGASEGVVEAGLCEGDELLCEVDLHGERLNSLP
jgi:hypothetical protein